LQIEISVSNSTEFSEDSTESLIKKRLGLQLTAQIVYEDGQEVDLS